MVMCLHVLFPFHSLTIVLVHGNVLEFNPSAGIRLDNLIPPTHEDMGEEYWCLNSLIFGRFVYES